MDTEEAYGIRFWRVRPSVARPGHIRNMVSCSVFRFSGAYRDSSRYAAGLELLAEAMITHLPTFYLRVYCDFSLDPRAIRAFAAARQKPKDEAEQVAQIWERCFSALSCIPDQRCEIVWFEAPVFKHPSDLGHLDLFGTLVRFIPLFHAPAPLGHAAGETGPSWCTAPPNGHVVYVADADYSDFTTEHVMLHTIAWYATAVDHHRAHTPPASASASVEAVEEEEEDVPHLVAVSFTGSAAPRHSPACGMPPFIANCIATRTRFPSAWLADVLQDAASSLSLASSMAHTLLGRYRDIVHDPRSRNYTYERRKMSLQQFFPFGVDEYVLTVVLKARSIARPITRMGLLGDGMGGTPGPHTWMFLVTPNVDVLLTKALGLVLHSVGGTGQGQGQGGGGAGAGACTAGSGGSSIDSRGEPGCLSPAQAQAVERLVRAAALCAGAEAEVPPSPLSSLPLPALAALAHAWAQSWPTRAAARARLWHKFCYCEAWEGLPAVRAGSEPLSSSLLHLCCTLTDVLASGGWGHRGEEDLVAALQNADALAAIAPHLTFPLLFSVGGGRAVLQGGRHLGGRATPAGNSSSSSGGGAGGVPVVASLMASLRAVPGGVCAVQRKQRAAAT